MQIHLGLGFEFLQFYGTSLSSFRPSVLGQVAVVLSHTFFGGWMGGKGCPGLLLLWVEREVLAQSFLAFAPKAGLELPGTRLLAQGL